jgi:glycosyltransferase involved in cell wall biosynthesis
MWKGVTRDVFAPILRRIVAASDAITVISSYTGQRLREYVPRVETVTIPFGAAAVEKGEAIPESQQTRKLDDPFELLFVGRLVKRKGVNVLLESVALLRDDHRLRIRIVGGGPEQQTLQSETQRLGLGDKVVFEGVVSAERVAELFRGCDALVLPAIVTETGDTEGLGVVLIEAMGYGKPVIASKAGGIVDIVSDGETGVLVPPGDATALAAAIQRAMDNPDELAAMAGRGTEFAGRAFGWDAIVSNLSSVYESAVAVRAGS